MIEHVWTVLCSRAVVDEYSKNASLQNTLEQIVIATEPLPETLIPFRHDVMSYWVRSDPDVPAKGKTRLSVVLPSGDVFGSNELEIDLVAHTTMRNRIHFEALPIAEAGRHHFVVELQIEGKEEWQQVAAIPLMLIFAPPEELSDEPPQDLEAST